jgi:uncharacterized membrane protein YgcG
MMRQTTLLATALAVLASLVGCDFSDTPSNQCVDIQGCNGFNEQACIDLAGDGTCADEYYTVGTQTFHCASCDDRTSCTAAATAACSAMSPSSSTETPGSSSSGGSGSSSGGGAAPGGACGSDGDCASGYCDPSSGSCA